MLFVFDSINVAKAYTTTKLLLQTYVNIKLWVEFSWVVCGQRDARESVCQSRHAQCIPIPTQSTCCRVNTHARTHSPVLRALHAPRPACCCGHKLLQIAVVRAAAAVGRQWKYICSSTPSPLTHLPNGAPQRISVLRWRDGALRADCT